MSKESKPRYSKIYAIENLFELEEMIEEYKEKERRIRGVEELRDYTCVAIAFSSVEDSEGNLIVTVERMY